MAENDKAKYDATQLAELLNEHEKLQAKLKPLLSSVLGKGDVTAGEQERQTERESKRESEREYQTEREGNPNLSFVVRKLDK
jgi:hypothetical protein